MIRVLIKAIVIVGIVYLGLTAYVGFRVARGIDDAKAHSVTTRVGARLMGRDAVERLAIRKVNLPGWVTGSPSFWWALRAYE